MMLQISPNRHSLLCCNENLDIFHDRNEAETVTCICRRVQELLGKVPFGVQPIGIDSRVDEVIKMLNRQVNGVCLIGICGLGGIGKTTIAKAIYDKLHGEFDGGSFISDIREMAVTKGLPSIQEKLICDVLKKESVSICTVNEGRNIIKRKLGGKRVLVILDDIGKLVQLKALSGDHICYKPQDLFGAGSKIIVTTRDKAVLLSYGMKEHQIFYPQELKHPWPLKLFHQHAFIHEPPSPELLELAKEAARVAGGLPLVLVIYGSVFAGLRTKEEWEHELEKLSKSQQRDILEKLRWSYDGLDNEQKCVFLDIACFLVRAKRMYAIYLWDDYSPGNAIRVLQERSLISIDDEDRFRMHDQVQEMGRWIAHYEGNLDPCMNSRLCTRDEELIMSMDSEEKKRVEGIVLNMEEGCETNLSTKDFMGMSKLRLLHLNFVNFQDHGIDHFPKRLNWLRWRGCELESVTFDGRSFRNLAILDLSRSNISQLELKNKLDRLKVLDLSHCWYIETTPDFACTPKLEKLFLDDCIMLIEIHESICHLEDLTTLSMRNCEFVKELPRKHRHFIANLSKLMELNLQGCKSLQSLSKLPSSLKTLIIEGCGQLRAVHGFENLESIEWINMNGCEGIGYSMMNSLFEGMSFKHLEVLNVSGSRLPVPETAYRDVERLSFIFPLSSPSNPFLVERMQCYGDGIKSGYLTHVEVTIALKDMAKNQVIYGTIMTADRDLNDELDEQYGCSYALCFSEYDAINTFGWLGRPYEVYVSLGNFPLERIDIMVRRTRKWGRDDSEMICLNKSTENSGRIVVESRPSPSMSLQASSPSTSETYKSEFDIFLSSTKEDVSKSLIRNLYVALEAHGTHMFKDAGKSKGERRAFTERSLAVCMPVFSKSYAESNWCLDDVSKMVDCKKMVMPVYLDVDPLDVTYHRGFIGLYFSKT